MEAGFPVGPITLLDEVGIDVGAKIIKVMKKYYGDRMQFPDMTLIDDFIEEKRFGKKNSKGFYLYEKGESKVVNGKKVVDETIKRHLPKIESLMSNEEKSKVVGQTIEVHIFECFLHCLEEGILRDPEAGDLGAIIGNWIPTIYGWAFQVCRWFDHIQS